MKCTIGIDVGTYESKGVLVDVTTGDVLASAARPHQMLVPQVGWAEHRPREDWWGDFCAISQQLIADIRIDPKAIVGVAASAIGPCMLPVDAAGAPLMNGVLYGVDARAVAEIAEMTAQIGAGRIMAQGGNPLTTQAVGPKILWLKRHRPDLFARTARIHTSTSFIVEQLTGEAVIDHYTAANTLPLYDVDALAWSDRLMPDLIPLERLPRLAWSTDVVGGVTSAAAAATGLAAGTPVTCGTVDAAAEALSVGVLDGGDMMIMYGSTIFIIMITDTPMRDPRLFYAPWLFKGQHAGMAGMATTGTLTHWFRDQLARDLGRETAMTVLTTEAHASPPGARGLIVLPYFAGVQAPLYDPAARGTVFGLNLTHTRGDLFRAMLEGIAHGTAHIVDTYGDAGHSPKRLIAVGGGVKNAVWSQATSDVTGRPQTVRSKSTGASYGNAFLAGLATGHVASRAIVSWNPTEREIVPDPALAATYHSASSTYRELYRLTQPLLAQL